MDLQYYKIFNEDTSQGVVGLLRPLKTSQETKKVFRLDETTFPISATDYFFVEDEPAHPIYVFKIPKEVNTLVDHEMKISKDMEELSTYLPHFNRIFEVKRDVKCYIPNSRKKFQNQVESNPFSSFNCVRDVSIIEYIPSKLTLKRYITETNFSGCTDPLIHQLILALFIAQKEKNFTHYDMHLENVLLRRCLKRTFFWYKFLYEGVTINRLVYTNGYFPVLFDYGFAYSKGLESTSYNNSLFFTNKGYTPFMFNEVTDFKTLIIRLAYMRNCPSKFKTIANDHFLKTNQVKFKLDKDTGWINTTVSSAAKIVCKRLGKAIIKFDSEYKENFIYKELDNVIELFGVLIKVPINQNNFKVKKLDNMVKNFLTEWNKIDVWFRSTVTDDKLNIIKRIVETINDLLQEEEENEPNNDDLNHKFKLKLFEIFDAFGDFVNVEDLDYGLFLASIIGISNFIEYTVYGEIQRYKKLFKFNDSMDSWTLFNLIEDVVGPKEPYKFENDDSIVLFDCMEKSTSSFELKDNDIIEALNLSPTIDSQLCFLDSLELQNIQ
jgi:hypothetical protein